MTAAILGDAREDLGRLRFANAGYSADAGQSALSGGDHLADHSETHEGSNEGRSRGMVGTGRDPARHLKEIANCVDRERSL